MKRFFVFLILGAFVGYMNHSAYANLTTARLDARMKAVNSLVCVGLDPDPQKMPLQYIQNDSKIEDGIFSFLCRVVDLTADHACAYKIQKAFFDPLNQGHDLLQRLCNYLKTTQPAIPILIDCKIGDTENTMQTYVHYIFDQMHADGVVVNPYMGDDVFLPFLQDANKTALVLVQTSNPSARVVQELPLANGRNLWEEILVLVLNRWNVNENLIPVLSSHASLETYREVRNLIPDRTPVLLAGIGAQGGDPRVLQTLLNRDGRGVFVNSSRGILYPYHPADSDWESRVVNAVVALKNQLNGLRTERSQ